MVVSTWCRGLDYVHWVVGIMERGRGLDIEAVSHQINAATCFKQSWS
jgi:hypothetical protein